MTSPIMDGPCDDCGREYPPWAAVNAWWNEVMGSEAGMLCPTCFLVRADQGPGPSPVFHPPPDSTADAEVKAIISAAQSIGLRMRSYRERYGQ